MGSVNWTPQQHAAIHTSGCNILVSAGAGSGKTAVLTERCAHLMADAEPPCPVDRLLVVTFTEAAAAEMRERIAAALEKRIAQSPGNSFLRRQRLLLDSASISTIHAFCRRTLERFFAHANIEPRAQLIVEPETTLLRRQIAQEVLNDFMQRTDATGEAFIEFLAAHAPGSPDPLIRSLHGIDDFLGSIPDPDAWVQHALQSLEPPPSGELPETWFAEWRQALTDELRGQHTFVERAIATIQASSPVAVRFAEILQEYASALDEWLGQIAKRPTADTIDRICEECIPLLKLPRGPSKTPKIKSLPGEDFRAFETAQKMLADIRDKLLKKRLQVPFAHCTTQHWADTIRRIAPHVHTVLDLVRENQARYQAVKQDRGVLDFNDLERKMLALLSDESNGVAERLRSQYDHILVDEFQDVNRLQARILELLSRQSATGQADNSFAVGDLKQSIYRFRLAEPTLFIERQQAYRTSAEGRAEPGQPAGLPIDLVENFRSSPRLIDGINAIFERLMTHDFGGADYDEHARLRAGREDEPPESGEEDSSTSAPIELHILDEQTKPPGSEAIDHANHEVLDAADWERIEREAYVIADRIEALKTAGTPYHDMVILLRSMQVHAAQLMRVLVRRGIPVSCSVPGDFFDATEVRDVLSLLRVLDNEQQDIPLAAVLRSPILGDPLTEAEFIEIRAGDDPTCLRLPFHETVRRYASQGANESLRTRLAEHLARLRSWRHRLRRRSLPDVLAEILTESGYGAYVLGRPEGNIRAANLRQLHQHARQFASFEQQGLHRFLDFLDELQEADKSLKEAPPPPLDDDVVRMMTIHSSKGLEFPVVFVAELGKQFNLADSRENILLDRTRGLAMRVVDAEQRIRYPSLPHRIISEHAKMESLAEEMRVLYVAMTRARERLILVGTMANRDYQSMLDTYVDHVGVIPLFDRRSAKNMLRWILDAVCCLAPSVVRSPTDTPESVSSPLIEVSTYEAVHYANWEILPPEHAHVQARLAAHASFPPIGDILANHDARAAVETLQRRLMTPYAHEPLTRIPAVASASILKNRWLASSADDEDPSASWTPTGTPSSVVAGIRLPRPSFCRAADAIAPSDRGTYTHELLERLDLHGPCDTDDLLTQLNTLVHAGVFTAQQADVIDLDGLVWFLGTELGQRLRHSQTCLHREWPFVLGVDPNRYEAAASAEDAQDIMLVRGVIDVLLDAGEGWEILDYKTDNVSGEALAARAHGYRGQLDIYAEAVRALWQAEVRKKWLVFLSPREIVCQE